MDKFKAEELQLYNKALVDAEQFRDIFDIMNSAVVVFRISEDRKDFICTDINRAAEIRKYYSESSRRVFSEQMDFKSQ